MRDFKGSSGLFGVELKPVSVAAMNAFFDGFHHFGLGYSWGGYESLVIPSVFKRTAKEFEHQGPLIRFHAGLEDADDLIADIDAAFARMKAAS
jgi:cystathionine beta-lyase